MGIMETGIKMIKEKMNMVIPVIMIKGDLKNILTETITGTVHFMKGLVMVTETKYISHIEEAVSKVDSLLFVHFSKKYKTFLLKWTTHL